MTVHVTLLYAGLTALLIALLGINVTRTRAKVKHFINPAQPPQELYSAMRAHGNAVEWAPVSFLVLLLLELSGVGSLPLHLLGGTILLSRVLHATGALLGNSLTIAGAGLTYVVLPLMSVWAVVRHFTA